MGTSPEQLQRILVQLDPLPVTASRMFGEYAIRLADRIPAFVTDGVLGIKVTEVQDPRLTPDLLGPIYPGSKDYWRIPDRLLADGDWLREILMETIAHVEPRKPKRPKASGSASRR